MSMKRFENKVVLVTGTSRNTGVGIAALFMREGARVFVCSSTAASTAKGAAELRAMGLENFVEAPADIGDPAQVEALFDLIREKAGRLDIVVNNAGVTRDDLLVRMTEEKWDTVLDINLKGAFFVTREAAKLMMRARSGAIVNIASVVGLMGNAGQANYSASKGGLIALTKTTARELGGRGVRVNAVAPGFINSKMTEVLPDNVKQQMLSIIPLKKFGEVSDIAKTVAFLASDNAAYITGQVISVNGGMLMP